MNYYDETVKFFNDTKIPICYKKIDNQFWIKEVKDRKREEVHRKLDSLADWDFNILGEIEEKTNSIKVHFDELVINYNKVSEDLKLSNRKKLKISWNCVEKTKISISIPVFNEEKNKAIIERKGNTFVFKKDDLGIWVFDGPGITSSH